MSYRRNMAAVKTTKKKLMNLSVVISLYSLPIRRLLQTLLTRLKPSILLA